MVGSSLWLWTIDAPAAMQARASAVISSGERGTWGLKAFGIPPFSATSMIAPDTTLILLYPGYNIRGGLRAARDQHLSHCGQHRCPHPWAGARGAGLRVALRARAHPHPGQPPDPHP